MLRKMHVYFLIVSMSVFRLEFNPKLGYLNVCYAFFEEIAATWLAACLALAYLRRRFQSSN